MKRIKTCLMICAASLIFASCQQIESAANLKSLLPEDLFIDPSVIRIDDMLLDRERLQEISINGAGGLTIYGGRPWRDGILPVAFGDEVPQKRRDWFLKIAKQWELNTPVRIVPRTNQVEYLLVRSNQYGCFSGVGANPSRVQILNLSEGCWGTATTLHEIGHALGLMHEHQRPDRNQFLMINLENADPQYAYAFDLFSIADRATGYDFLSIMHYSQTAFSKNGKPTMIAKPPFERFQNVMGIKKISELDRQAIRALYQR